MTLTPKSFSRPFNLECCCYLTMKICLSKKKVLTSQYSKFYVFISVDYGYEIGKNFYIMS